MWTQRADVVQRVLLRDYRNAAVGNGWPGLFRMRSPVRGRDRWRLHYWWQAHALDAMVDAQERRPTGDGLRRIRAFARGIRIANRGRIVNAYYDDMAWMGLAMLRADRVGGGTIGLARRLWEEIAAAWNEESGGGIPWRRSQLDYKNAPANGPAAILAARLHKRDGDAGTLEWAQRIAYWLRSTLVDPDTGLVWDGINQRGDGQIEKKLFTYNQGVVIGAELELRSITGDREPLERATRTATAAIERLAPHGVLPDEGGGDGGLFKGILVRYLAEVDDSRVASFLAANGEAAWAAREARGRFGPSWLKAPDEQVELSTHLSGVMLMERLAALEGAGDAG